MTANVTLQVLSIATALASLLSSGSPLKAGAQPLPAPFGLSEAGQPVTLESSPGNRALSWDMVWDGELGDISGLIDGAHPNITDSIQYEDLLQNWEETQSGSPGSLPTPAPNGGIATESGKPNSLIVTAFQVILSDNRVEVQDTRYYPFRTVGQVTYCVSPSDCGYSCTGTLISPSFVLTAGHCVYEIESGIWHQSITYIPAISGSTAPFGVYTGPQITRMYVPSGYSQGQDPQYDLGLIELSEPIGEQLGWMGISHYNTLQVLSTQTMGYPVDKPLNTPWWTYCTGMISDYATPVNQVDHTCDTYGGDSGAPLWVYDPVEDSHNIAAINIAHPLDSSAYNVATLLNRNFREFMFRIILSRAAETLAAAAAAAGSAVGR